MCLVAVERGDGHLLAVERVIGYVLAVERVVGGWSVANPPCFWYIFPDSSSQCRKQHARIHAD